MADGGEEYRPPKRKLPSMSELLNKSKELLGISKKKQRRPSHFEFSTDPVTGVRNNKGTYTGQLKKRRKEIGESGECAPTFELDHDGFPDDEDCNSSICSTMTGEMRRILLDAQDLMIRLQGSASTPKKQKWADRQSSLNDSWAGYRSTIFKVVLETTFAVPEDLTCQKCNKFADVKCNECLSSKYLCQECDHSTHEYLPFHDRDAIVNRHFVPIPAATAGDSKGEWVTVERSLPLTDVYCTTCNGKCKPLEILPDSHCIVVTLRGRFDVNHRRYQCQKCSTSLSTSNPVVVTQSGFWPGSIKDMSYVFDQDLFLHWDILQKQIPGVSERSFLKSLELFSKQKGRVPTINATAFGVSFKEWKFCQFELDKLRHINWMKCPACDDHQHSVHMDGNMKLYRFKSAGMRKRDTYYGETFVVSNEKVDNHIHKVYQGSKQKKADEPGKCGESNWRAAGNTIKKKKNLCETGLEISGCRHDTAQHAINMMYGEVYGYAHYLQVNYYIPKKVEFFWYDVVCKYWPWLKKHDKETAEKMKPALSVMHSRQLVLIRQLGKNSYQSTKYWPSYHIMCQLAFL